MSTLAVVEEILREAAVPMSVREIVERAGVRLPSKSKTPDTVVARDLAMDIKKKGESSLFIRTSPGRYTLRALVTLAPAQPEAQEVVAPVSEMSRLASPPMATVAARKPAVPAPGPAVRVAGLADSAEGGGFAS